MTPRFIPTHLVPFVALQCLTSIHVGAYNGDVFRSAKGARVVPLHCKVLAEISHGGMGTLYRALDLRLNRELAFVLPRILQTFPNPKQEGF